MMDVPVALRPRLEFLAVVIPPFLSGNRGMNRDCILIRVDATPRSGYERFSRCMTLAAALQRRRRPTYFFSQLEPTVLAFSIKRGGNDWIDACHPAGSSDDLEDFIQEIRR